MGKTMTKAELIAAAAEKAGLAKADAGRVLGALVEVIQAEVAAGTTVKVAGFGHFKPKIRKARIGRNPATGAEVQIPETTSIGFRASRPAKPAGDAS